MFDFPTTPATGTIVTMPDGSFRVWDSQKWRAAPSANVVIPPTGFLPLAGGTLSGDLNIGTDTVSARLSLNGPTTNALRNIIWRSAGAARWVIGPDGSAEAASVTAVTSAAVASGANVLPVVTTAGVTSGMQVSVAGVTTTTGVVSAVGTASASTTATASVAVGNRVIPLANTAGFLVGMTVAGSGIPASALVKSVGGTSGVVTTTATSTVYPSFMGQVMTVSDITNVFPGMLAAGNGIAPDAFVTATSVAADGRFAVSLSKDFTDNIISGQTITFSPAIVLPLLTPATGTVASGSTITAGPAIVTSQNTTATIASGTTVTLIPNTGNALHLNVGNDAGQPWLIPISVSRGTGVVNLAEGLTITPPVTQVPNSLTTFQPIIFSNSSWSGSPSAANLFYRFHQFTMHDNVDAGNLGTVGFHIAHTYGGNQTSGGRVGQAIQLYQAQGFTTPGGFGSRYNNIRIGLNVDVRAGENAGGTAPTIAGAAGAVFGLGSYSKLFGPGDSGYVTGAQNFFELCGYNINIAARTGSSVAVKHALTIDPTSDDKVQGSVEDACIQMAMQSGAIGWKNQIALGNMSGSWPLSATSNIWGTYRSGAPRAMQANYGLNWRDIAFTTAPIAVPGFVVDGAGNLTSGALRVTTTGNTTSIDTTLVHVTNTVLHSPSGSSGGWTPGMGLYDASGNQWLCTTTDGSAVDGITGKITGVSAVPIGPAFIAGPPPSNPVAVTDQSGHQTANLDLTWSTAPALSIQPSGGAVTLGGTITANPGPVLVGTTAAVGTELLNVNGGFVMGGPIATAVGGTINVSGTTTPLVINQGVTSAMPVAAPNNTSIWIINGTGGPRLQLDGFGNNPAVGMRRSNGTAAAPTAVTGNQPIGSLQFQAYDGTAWATGGQIVLNSQITGWNATDHSTYMTFLGTKQGSTVATEQMRLQQGHLIVGATVDNAIDTLQITGSAKCTILGEGVTNNITLTGSNQATALSLTTGLNVITSVPVGSGAILPQVGSIVSTGTFFDIINSTTVAAKIYGTSPATIDGVATATGVTLSGNARCRYWAITNTAWISTLMGAPSA